MMNIVPMYSQALGGIKLKVHPEDETIAREILNELNGNENLKIVCAFDNDPTKIGQELCGYRIYSIDEMNKVLKQEKITVAISTVPSQNAQQAINQVVENGITAILNFAPDPLVVPENVHVHYIDLTSELQTLIYFDGQ
ncbi:MAG: hypothetical protein RR965_04030, partial [Enterococcus sp.]